MSEQEPKDLGIEPLTRPQVLVAIAVTALVLLAIAKLWLYLSSVQQIPLTWNPIALPIGLGVGLAITLASAIVYRLWPAYRRSADTYLELILKPLVWPDLIWLGLLPGMSEELLFRGIMLPAFGLNAIGLMFSSVFFGVLHLSGREQWPYMLWAIFVGAVLGACALLSGNLLVPIVAHASANWISSSLWKSRNRGSKLS
ncbi:MULTISPECIES: CPBP family intramembrane glutamic endopeptidase [Planktothricoides]|uniref:CPBP family intramembrane glutamic endopeptidase n=2 Tax=Planktothricoides raciborskii TaxID=132608 RepID=A0AAU8J860_9CYAN|nr:MULTISPECIES: CPBP family intramembrane glutamic endopeptidase [Planktothricoides]KOR36042.1 abortive phage infection protein [Planktothricoides sp. SR001]MBD2545538.1 CPBP family intramembrane metalloprotease [Planktothricoides raciborskii FACHB-1370]MBD2583444.1 CPBP family intramembrane metalloprotease [Planktothricoides raciborskii FACHB-1261]